MSPVLILGTGIVINAASSEKAGSASSIAEMSNQLGVAMGVALLGSIGNYIYRITIKQSIPALLSAKYAKSAEEGIFASSVVAAGLNAADKNLFLLSAKNAFVSGLHAVALTATIISLLLAFMTAIGLRTLKS